MPEACLLPVAQYVRQSTRLQQYSIVNQVSVNEVYASEHGYRIVATYNDGGRSGVVIRNRPALQQLLNDVVSGKGEFEAILVYDVSRWGRFQNTDEAAHYEYICKLAGKPVHYTAESFPDDRSLPAAIMKTLKRTMAGEFSREQGDRVYHGQSRIAQLGFKVGSAPSFGLRRMLVPSDGRRALILERGQRKHLASDHVTLVPGPDKEVRIVRRIFALFVAGRSITQIATELNREHVTYSDGSPWTYSRVYDMLKNPKYAGVSVWGRYSSRLYTPQRLNPPGEWIQIPNAFPAVIEPETFTKANKIFEARSKSISNKQLLKELRRLLARHGRLSDSLIRTLKGRGHRMCAMRFGSMANAYKAAGYAYSPILARRVERIRLNRNLRLEVLKKIRSLFSAEWQSEFCPERSRRRVVVFRCGRTLSVQILTRDSLPGPVKWFRRPASDHGVISAKLFCLAAPSLKSISRFYLAAPDFSSGSRFTEERLKHLGVKRLGGLESLYRSLQEIPLCQWRR